MQLPSHTGHSTISTLDVSTYVSVEGPRPHSLRCPPQHPPQNLHQELVQATAFYHQNIHSVQDSQIGHTVAFSPDYLANRDQPPLVDCANEYIDTLVPSTIPFSAVVEGADNAQFGMLTATMPDNMQFGRWHDASTQQNSSNFGILLPDQRGGGKRGPFKDAKLREQTAQTRRTGSCIRCRMQRIRVSSQVCRIIRTWHVHDAGCGLQASAEQH